MNDMFCFFPCGSGRECVCRRSLAVMIGFPILHIRILFTHVITSRQIIGYHIVEIRRRPSHNSSNEVTTHRPPKNHLTPHSQIRGWWFISASVGGILGTEYLYLTPVGRFENEEGWSYYMCIHTFFGAHGWRGVGRFSYDEPFMPRTARRTGQGRY